MKVFYCFIKKKNIYIYIYIYILFVFLIFFQEHSNLSPAFILSPADISIWVSLWSTILLPDIKDDISKDLSNVNNWLINIEKQPVIQV